MESALIRSVSACMFSPSQQPRATAGMPAASAGQAAEPLLADGEDDGRRRCFRQDTLRGDGRLVESGVDH
jgi:hypothetical protein